MVSWSIPHAHAAAGGAVRESANNSSIWWAFCLPSVRGALQLLLKAPPPLVLDRLHLLAV